METQKENEKDIHMGALFSWIRKLQGLERKQVCYGLYDSATCARFEEGSLEPDSFVLEVLFERIGASLGEYGTLYSLPEYLFLERRNEIVYALRKGFWGAVKQLLQEYEREIEEALGEHTRRNTQGIGKEELHRQFIGYIWNALWMEQGDRSDRREELLTLLRLTVPGFSFEQIQSFLYGKQEQAILILLAEQECRQGKYGKCYPERQSRLQTGIWLYQEILTYIETHCLDKKRLNYLYPETVLSLAEKLAEEKRYSELSVCEKGLVCLWEQHRMYGLKGLLRLSLLGWEKGGVPVLEGEDPELYQKAILILDILQKNLEAIWRIRRCHYPLLNTVYRGQVLGERLLRLRLSKKRPLDEVCQDICEPERLSAIERGESKPTMKRFIRLMERLEADTCRFYPKIRTKRYDLILLATEIDMLISSRRYQEAEEELQKLKKGLEEENGQKNVFNKQYLDSSYAIIEGELGKISREQELEMLLKAFHLTVNEGCDLRLWPLTKIEVEILNSISIALENLGDRKEAIRLLQEAKKRYHVTMSQLVKFREKSRMKEKKGVVQYREEGMKLEYNATAYLLVVENLVNSLGSDGDYDEALKLAEEAFPLAYQMQKSYVVSNLLYEIAWNTEQKMEQEKQDMAAIRKVCIPLFYQSYVIAAIAKQSADAKFIKKRCEKKYGVKWG